ncbi:MAG: AIPR family protein, partial [Candidatus Omnitrophica bacterium]|nr:AIPR family protein [Candidatus Omnitrophota bacterium]
ISDNAFNIEHHILLVKASDIPAGISLEPNPRAQKTDYGIYKEVQESLENEDDPSFHLKNKGITMFAHKIEMSEDKKVTSVYLGKGDGIADGGHTYKIILDSISQNRCPKNQYVKFEILTGVPDTHKVDITGGLNTAVQVQEASLANLEGRFEWIKQTLKDAPYANQIAYKQNEKKPVDIREIIAYMTLFNVEHPLLRNRSLKEAYASKNACLTLYKDKQDTYMMLKPILKDILCLRDYIDLNARELYNKKTKGKGGAMVGIYSKRSRGKFQLLFMQAESEYKLFDSALYPMLGALRYLVHIKPGEKEYSWKIGSLEKVKAIYRSVAADMLRTTYNTSSAYGKKQTSVGKDENLWDSLYKTVALAYLQKQ